MENVGSTKIEENYRGVLLERTLEFSQWLELANLGANSSNGQKALPEGIANVINIQEVVNFDSTLALLPAEDIDALLVDKAPKLLECELSQWCPDKSLWPADSSFLTFLELFNLNPCDKTIIFSDSKNDDNFSSKEAFDCQQRFSLTLRPYDELMHYLNQIFVAHTMLPHDFDDTKARIQEYTCAFIMPKNITTLEAVWDFIEKNYQQIHDLQIKNYLNEQIEWGKLTVSYEEFKKIFYCDVHSRLLVVN